MEHTTSAREIQDWDAYYKVEPWGAARDNMHAGIVAAMVYNVNRGKDRKALTFADFALSVPERTANTIETVKFVTALRALAKPKKRS